MAAGVVALPEPAHRNLSSDVPDLQVQIRQGNGCDILANGRDGLAGVGRGSALGSGLVEGLDLREKGGLAGIVEAQ